jgi:pyrophosphatase PpaX
MAISALLFDLDGTLIDSIELLLRSMEAAFVDHRPRPTRAQWTAGIGTPLRTQLAEWCTTDQQVVTLVDRYREYQDQHLESLTTLFAGVLETIKWAKAAGLRTAVVTSKGRIMTARSLTHVGLDNVFDTIVTFEETTKHKPAPEPVLLALSRLGLAPSEAIFVGDSPHDMLSGNAAGVQTAAAQWGPFSHDVLAGTNPTYWLSRMDELPGIVNGFDRPR